MIKIETIETISVNYKNLLNFNKNFKQFQKISLKINKNVKIFIEISLIHWNNFRELQKLIKFWGKFEKNS